MKFSFTKLTSVSFCTDPVIRCSPDSGPGNDGGTSWLPAVRAQIFCVLVFLASAGAYAQSPAAAKSLTATGVVTDARGEALPSVTVTEKGSRTAVVTSVDGKYTIAVGSAKAVLVFTSVGFLTREVAVNVKGSTDVQLQSAVNDLSEVVVIGYGTEKKSDLTGSVGLVSLKNQDKGAYDNFQQLIAGKVAGVSVTQTSGAPGAGLNIEIRGVSSLNYTTQPLYVIDGVPLQEIGLGALNNGNINALGATGSSPLATINPNDIASIEILKDASATAIYGSRGSNGVVLITTKSGKAGKTKINVSYSNGSSKMLKYLDLLSGEEFANFANEVYYNRNPTLAPGAGNPPYTQAEMLNLPNYDHQREITRAAQTGDLSINFSGGDVKSKYYVSGQYYKQEGIIRGTDLKRFAGKFNYENNLFKDLKLTTQLSLSNSVASGNVLNSNFGGLLVNALAWAPTSPFLNPDGSFNSVRSYEYGSSSLTDPVYGTVYYNPRFANSFVSNISFSVNNPLSYIQGVTNDNTSNQLVGNMNLTYTLSKFLKLSGVLGVSTYNTLLENYIPTTTPINSSLKGVATLGTLQTYNLLYQTTLTYARVVKKHSINVVVGATAESSEQKSQSQSAQGFTTDATGTNAIQGGTVVQTPNSGYNGSSLLSMLIRNSYNYASKYYLTLSARYDGSSKFAEGNRFGFFPSAGVSWRISNENFIKKIDAISELKLRGSYGIIGNQAVGSYSTLSTLSSANVMLGGAINAGYAPSRLPNPDLKWEQTKQADIGLDFGLFANRILITADAYNKRTSNLIYQVSVPATSGFSTTLKNIASIENRGLEFSIATTNVRTESVTWTTDFNISFNRNKVLSISGKDNEFVPIYQVIGSGYLSKLQKGEPIGQFYGFRTIQTWNDETILTKPIDFQKGVKAGDRRYEDVNNDGLLTDKDRVYIGSALPKYSGGFSNSVKYKSLELSVFFAYSYGNQVFNQMNFNLTYLGGFNNISQKTYENRYIQLKPSMDAEARAAAIEKNKNTQTMAPGTTMDPREVTDYYVETASYVRCRDIIMNYGLPAKWARTVKASSINVYVNVQNAFTITPYKGYNPEGSSTSGLARGLDNGTYPLARTLRFGANLSF